MQEALVVEFQKIIEKRYGGNQLESNDYCHIINDRHFNRLKDLIDSSKSKIVVGGKSDENSHCIEFTVIKNASESDKAMKDEIFGPILPMVTTNSIQESIQYINARDKPLAMYIFSSDKKVINEILSNTSSGGVCINDCIMQLSTHRGMSYYIILIILN